MKFMKKLKFMKFIKNKWKFKENLWNKLKFKRKYMKFMEKMKI